MVAPAPTGALPVAPSGTLALMSGGFRVSRGSAGESWFRLGRLEVGTVMLVVLAVVVSWVVLLVAPSLVIELAYAPSSVLAGEVWRIVSWPFANQLGLWAILNLFFFWYFGTDLERHTGPARMAWLLIGIWASLTVAATLAALILGGGGMLAGIGLIQGLLLLLWIAEYPQRPIFFGIRAWVIGAILLGLQVFTRVAAGDWVGLMSLAFSLVLVAVVARRVGLLDDYPWIPGRRRTASAPRASRRKSRRRSGTVSTIRPSRAQERKAQRTASDRERLDELLDEISARGIDNLTDAERKELLQLRERLRGH